MPRVGDKIFVLVDHDIKHYGIHAGHDLLDREFVVHNAKRRGVIKTSMSEFSQARHVEVEYRPCDSRHAELIVQRAESLIGSNFDLLFFNCEQAANLAAFGRPFSLQIQGAVGLVVLAGLCVFVVSRD